MMNDLELIKIVRDEWLKVKLGLIPIENRVTITAFSYDSLKFHGLCEFITVLKVRQILNDYERTEVKNILQEYKEKWMPEIDDNRYWFTMPNSDYDKAYNKRLTFLENIIKDKQ